MYKQGEKVKVQWRKMLHLATDPVTVKFLRNKPDEEKAVVSDFIPAGEAIPATLVPSHFTQEHGTKPSDCDRVAFITESDRKIVLGARYFSFLPRV